MTIRASAFFTCVLGIVCGCTGRSDETPEVGAPYGAHCTGNLDCASGLCAVLAEPFCTQECFDDCTCPAGAVCARVSDTLSICAPGDNTCVAPMGDAGTTPVDGGEPPFDAGSVMSGGGAGAPCRTDEDCGEVTSRGGTGGTPMRVTVPQVCWSESVTGLPGGLCTMTDCVRNVVRDPCPVGFECLSFSGGTRSLCTAQCESTSDCRTGYVCRDDIDSPGIAHDNVCWLPCSRTGCDDGLLCLSDGTCGEPTVTPVDYDVTTRSATLSSPYSPASGSVSGGSSLTFALPFEVQFFSETFPAGTDVVATWQGLFAFDRSSLTAFVPGNRTRYATAAPVIVAHHYANTSSSVGSISYSVFGTAPNRTLEIDWVTSNLLGGGARFRLRFDEGSPTFVVHYGMIMDDGFSETWTQLAMLDDTQYEEVVVSTGTPTPAARANTEFTYTPR